jgi:hypothetical protein
MNSRKFDYMMSFVLLGLIHGGLEIDKEVKFDRDTSTIKLGSGIAVAIPGETIHELLMESSDLKIQRMEMLEQMTAEKNPPTT